MKNEKIKEISIKIILTIPAIVFGLIRLCLFTFEPLIKLWKPKTKPTFLFTSLEE